MTTAAHTHEDLATKQHVDVRFDRLEERLAESDYKHTQNYAQLSNSFVSMLNVMTSLTERMTKLEERMTKSEENQRDMIEILERIEKSTSRGVGF